MGGLDLPQHMGFADHLTVQRAGHREQVPDGIAAGQGVKLGRQRLRRHARALGQGSGRDGGGSGRIGGCGQHLHPVAGREPQELGKPAGLEAGEHAGDFGFLGADQVADGARTGPVIDTDQNQFGRRMRPASGHGGRLGETGRA